MKILILIAITIVVSNVRFSSAQDVTEIHSIDHCAQIKKLSKNHAIDQRSKGASADYDLKYHRFYWELDPDTLFIRGCVDSRFVANQNLEQIQFELSNDLIVEAVLQGNDSLTFQHSQDKLIVYFKSQIAQGSFDSVKVYYFGTPMNVEYRGSFFRVWHGSPDSVPIISTLSEPYGAQDWWPCKNDLSDKIDSIDVFIETSKKYTAVSNGVLQSRQDIGGGHVFHYKHRYPIASYLIAVSVTNYELILKESHLKHDTLPVFNYFFPEYIDYKHRLDQLCNEMIPLMDSLFGPYPFSKEQYGHAQWEYPGGMEHQTITFIGKLDFNVTYHELAHQWFGNLVTCGSWADIWLNEGFATYATGLAFEHLEDGYWWDTWKTKTLNEILTETNGSVYVDDTSSVDRIFDQRLTYYKGAYLLHMLRWVVGDTDFYEGINNYLTDASFAYGYVRSDDFIDHMEQVHGQDLDWFFDDWLYGEGHPIYTIGYTQPEGIFHLEIDQSQSHSSVSEFEMPIELILWGQGRDTTIVIQHNDNTWLHGVDLGFYVDSMQFDPNKWLLAEHGFALSIEELQVEEVIVHPIPVKDLLTVTLQLENGGNMTLFDINGIRIFSSKIQDRTSHLDLSSLCSGIYFLEVNSRDKTIVKKIVKQ